MQLEMGRVFGWTKGNSRKKVQIGPILDAVMLHEMEV